MGILKAILRSILEQNLGVLGRALSNRLADREAHDSYLRHAEQTSADSSNPPISANDHEGRARARSQEVVYQIRDGYSWRDIHHGYNVGHGQSIAHELDNLEGRYPDRQVRAIDKQSGALLDMI